jgi:hypothetical protein
MKIVFLITKLKITNLVNESLSNEIIRLFSGISKEVNLVNSHHYDFNNYFNNVFPRNQQMVQRNAPWLNEMIPIGQTI